MKHNFPLFLVALACVAVGCSHKAGFRAADRHYDVCAGQLTALTTYSEQLGRDVDIDIWTPAGYPQEGKRYPVLYMHDGQNVMDIVPFNGQSWHIDDVITRMGDSIDAPIVVAVYNTMARNADYMPANYQELMPDSVDFGEAFMSPRRTNAKEYVDFLVHTLKPYVDSVYQTNPSKEATAVMGSSMGALVSVYAWQAYPDVFGYVMGLSYPAIRMVWPYILESWKVQVPGVNSTYLYLDCGTGFLDSTFMPQFTEIEPVLLAAGWDSAHISTPVYPGADHNEDAWFRRLDVPLMWAFGTK